MSESLIEKLMGFGVLGLIIIVFSVTSRPVSDVGDGYYQVTAGFNRVDGLEVGSPVRMGGVDVGSVASMKLDSQFRAMVSLTVRDDFKLPLDSSAAIHTDGLFGAKFIEVEPGGELDYLQSGDEIDFTQDAVIVSELLDLIIAQGKAAQARAAETLKQLQDQQQQNTEQGQEN
ncbi:MAG: MlaD family protein [Magnetovibrionaceae bacterium]